MPTLESLSAESLRSLVIAFRDTVHAHADEINRLNVYPVPDGDTGTNMARTLDAVVAELDGAAEGLDATCDAISHGSLMGARGNSGVILSQLLRGMTATLKTRARTAGAATAATAATAASVAEALKASAASAYQAVLRPIEGTILTVAREAADAAHRAADDGATLAEVLRAGRAAGRLALDRTPEQLPVLRDAGVVDAGGAGFLLLFDAALHIVDGEPLPVPSGGPATAVAPATPRAASPGAVADLRYEVMFLLDLVDASIDDFRARWGRIGDSIVVVGGDGLWNCHVHTDDIGAAIEAALDAGGRPSRIRVTDLFEEAGADAEHHDDLVRMSLDDRDAAPGAPGHEHVTCAVVAVASGDGLAALFAQLGVQQVVRGGQTLNPSTAELLAAVQATVADEVIVLPNNGNIVPVAEQVAGVSDRRVVVVPTRSMPEALAALVCYDADADAATNAKAMEAAAAATSTGELTRAVRDSRSDVGPVGAGDWIGVARRHGRSEGIVAVGAEQAATAVSLVGHLVAGHQGAGLLSVVAGDDADPDVTATIVDAVTAAHPALEVEVHHGGQPLYPYLFGLE